MLAEYNVIFNFSEATAVRISGVAFRGSVIAPNANIVDATGVVWGSTFVKSMTGPIQINLKPLTCIKPALIKCRLRPPVLTSTVVVPTSTVVSKVPSTTTTSTIASVLPTSQPPVPSSTTCSTTTTTSCSTTTTTINSVQAVTDSQTTTSSCSSVKPTATIAVRAYRDVADDSVSVRFTRPPQVVR